MKEWMGLNALQSKQWANLDLLAWWNMMANGRMPNRKAMASITLLVSWEVWSERNARVFPTKYAPANVVFGKIRKEARMWELAGARRLGDLMTRE
jgi:hypothetical protein